MRKANSTTSGNAVLTSQFTILLPMAPQHQETATVQSSEAAALAPVAIKNALAQEVEHQVIDHPELFRVFPVTAYDPIPVLPYEDRGLKADPTLKNLLADATVTHLSPHIGTEISGIQLHELTDLQKDELAYLIAHRGVVFFRDQELNMDQQLDLGRYYGPLHIHQSFGHPEGYPEVHVIQQFAETSGELKKRQIYDMINEWHSDISYERQVSER